MSVDGMRGMCGSEMVMNEPKGRGGRRSPSGSAARAKATATPWVGAQHAAPHRRQARAGEGGR